VSESGRPGRRRERGRELALLALCHLEGTAPEERAAALSRLWDSDRNASESAETLVADLLKDDAVRRFARRLVDLLVEHWEDVDTQIEAVSRRWRLARMDQIDRSVLRLAAVELFHEKTPRGVVVSEAVRLADRYGSERSAAFVNGISESLAKVLRDV